MQGRINDANTNFSFMKIFALFLLLMVQGCSSLSKLGEVCMDEYAPMTVCMNGINARKSVNALLPGNQRRLNALQKQLLEKNNAESASIRKMSATDPRSKAWTEAIIRTNEAYKSIETASKSGTIQSMFNQRKLLPAIYLRMDNKSSEINVDSIEQWKTFLGNHKEMEITCNFLDPINCLELVENADKAVNYWNKGWSEGVYEKKEELKLVVEMKISFAESQRILEKSRYQQKNIFIVNELRFSPQIDVLGNLYLPSNFYEEFSQEDQNLILAHEAAHVVNNQNVDLPLLYKEQLLIYRRAILKHQKNCGDSNVRNVYDESTINNGIIRMASRFRNSDEIGADLLAIYAHELDPKRILRLYDLLNVYESPVNSRKKVLEATANLVSSGRSVKGILLARQENSNRACDDRRINEYKNSWSLNKSPEATSVRDALTEYSAFLLPNNIIQLSGEENYRPLPFKDIAKFVKAEFLVKGCALFNIYNESGAYTSYWFHSIDYME